jgi:hypothetical protein
MWDNIKMNLHEIEDQMLPWVAEVPRSQGHLTLRIEFSCVHVTHSNTSWFLSTTEVATSVRARHESLSRDSTYRLANFVTSHSASPV